MLCAFSTLIVHSQNDSLKDSQNQQEPEKKDFCSVLGEVCSKTSFKERRGGTTTYYFDQEKLKQRNQTDIEAIVNLYKEEMLSPQDSFYSIQKPKERITRLENSKMTKTNEYSFLQYYKGLKVVNGFISISTSKNDIPYSLKTNARPLNVDTTTKISIEEAVDAIREKFGDHLSPYDIPYYRYPLMQDVIKSIFLDTKSNNYTPRAVYEIILLDNKKYGDFISSTKYYVDVKTGRVIHFIPLTSFCGNYDQTTSVLLPTTYEGEQNMNVDLCIENEIEHYRLHTIDGTQEIEVFDMFKYLNAVKDFWNEYVNQNGTPPPPGNLPILNEEDYIISWNESEMNWDSESPNPPLSNHPDLTYQYMEDAFNSYHSINECVNYHKNKFSTNGYLDKVIAIANMAKATPDFSTNLLTVSHSYSCGAAFQADNVFSSITLSPYIVASNGDSGSSCNSGSHVSIVSHEHTHGMMQLHHNYYFDKIGKPETGLIEEALCDIFGLIIQQYSKDTSPEWNFGTEYGGFVRSMSDPYSSSETAPIFYKEMGKWVEVTYDENGFPTNLGAFWYDNNSIITHWFYLLSTGQSNTVSGNVIDGTPSGTPFSYSYNTEPGIGTLLAADIIWYTLVDNSPADPSIEPSIETITDFADAVMTYIDFNYNCEVYHMAYKAWQAVNIQPSATPCIPTDPNIYIRDSDDQKDYINKHGILTSTPIDRGNEPNIDCDYELDGTVWHQFIWDSPDIWNCAFDNPSCIEPGDPALHIDSGFSNTLNVRVHNRGADFDPSIHDMTLHAYWTMARTGELWPIHWNENQDDATGEIYAGFDPNFEGVSVPSDAILGGEMGTGQDLDNILAQGESQVFEFPWNPPSPDQNVGDYAIQTIQDGGYTGEPQMCLLARIESSNDPMADESINTDANGGRTSHNVYQNNNIATKNVAHLAIEGKPEKPNDIQVIIVNNDALTNGNLAIRFIENFKDQEGSLSDFGDLYIYPDHILWEKIVAGGFEGTGYTIHNADEKILRMTEGSSGFVIEDLDYEPTESRFVGFRFEENGSGKAGIDKTANFNHFLYHTVEYKDEETNETVERAGASGINFRSSFAPTTPQSNDFVTDDFIQMTPNPTTGLTRISFNLDKKSKVRLVVFDATGKEVALLSENKELAVGTHDFILDASKFTNGLYFVSLVLEDEIHSQKLVVGH